MQKTRLDMDQKSKHYINAGLRGTYMSKQTSNRDTQYYKGIPVILIVYTENHFARLKAKRFLIGDPKYKQNIWIPNQFLEPDGTIKPNVNIDFVFRKAYDQNKFKIAHIDINPYLF